MRLKIGESEAFKLFSSPFNDHLAYTIIKKWIAVYDKEANGHALYAALLDIIGHNSAEKFKELLLDRGEQ